MADLIIDDDVGFEDELARQPYSLKTWLQYIASKSSAPAKARFLLFERALAALPGSYKLWRAYLLARVESVKGRAVTDPRLEVVNATFERALIFMHKMPVIWVEYCSFLVEQRQLTRTRRTFDRALQSLPITQHDRIWPVYLAFVRSAGVRETTVRVYRRFLQYDSTGREEYADYLLSIGNVDEAAVQMAAMVNDERFTSLKGRTKHAMWMLLCDTVSRHPGRITSLRVDPVLRSGIARFSDEVGRLWCALAEFYVRSGAFEKARDVYEEALAGVATVRDFAVVFDAYSQFEEAMLTAKMELAREEGEAESSGSGGSSSRGGSGGVGVSSARVDGDADATGDAAAGSAPVAHARDLEPLSVLRESGDDTELRIARLELLMDRRPLLLSSVLLRQNPHNVHEWHKRARLYKDAGAPERVVTTYTEAVKTVDPLIAVGKPSTLWAAFGKYYEEHGDLANARVVFKRGTLASFKSPEDLASVWCEWAEMELRASAPREALKLMAEATAEHGGGRRPPPPPETGGGAPASAASVFESSRRKLCHNLRLWELYLDLAESLEPVDSVKAAYQRAIALKVATPAMVLNFASYLEERGFFEESFRAYERGVAVFPWPHALELWLAYLRKFTERYGGSKLERTRELYEQALGGCPPAHAAVIFKLYAGMEETHGLVRHAMAVFDRATRAVSDADRYDMFLTYIRKAEEHYGAPRTREIYERACEALPDALVKDVCVRFAAMETKLGETDRARAIYVHASQFADPRTTPEYWATWQDFEVAHGNEDTFREMLRVKRSVSAAFSAANYNSAEMLGGGAAAVTGGAGAAQLASVGGGAGGAPSSAGGTAAAATSAAAPSKQFTKPAPPPIAIRGATAATAAPAAAASIAADAAEISLDEEPEDTREIVAQAVPAAVFGGLQAKGALDRFKLKSAAAP